MSQLEKIENLLSDGDFHCTSEMYAMYIADVRRRLIDLKQKGLDLEGKKCELHDYHEGGSKMWRLNRKYKEPA